ncbi:hypothetical protein PTW35_25850 (plasmid) [Photobacterium sp. DA100]|uniref:hypothetical protein n=1 Tax=Photobacterium sp. DA100 TaxID=3027472 RepID=UPI002478AC60|nr:hypothetical protein [Photobacterium sp. DA100]WEM44682.1 hypothetical protein PTW35_25850 [Photobacterium sp. DA100]
MSLENSKLKQIKSAKVLIGGQELPVFLVNDEIRWSMRQASRACGFNESWLSDNMRKNTRTLELLTQLGFQGDIIPISNGKFQEAHTISTDDFMHAVVYAAQTSLKPQAIALLAASVMEAFERRAYRSLGIPINEEEFIERFELRHASVLMNIELRLAIQSWIETAKGFENGLSNYIIKHKAFFKSHGVPHNERGIYGGTIRLIYLRSFRMGKEEINRLLGTKHYESVRDNIDTSQLKLISTIEQMVANRIMNKGSAPFEAVEEVIDFMGLQPELPRSGDRITAKDVRKIIALK